MRVEDQVVKNPTFMLVGEAPGREEDKTGKPFQGRSGDQLNRLLTAAGIIREECYITNVIDERPAKNDFSIFYQDSQRKVPTETLHYLCVDLRAKISEVKPKVVVALGNESMRAIVGTRGVEARRGSIYYCGDIPVIPTFHPSAILRGGGTSHWYTPAAIHDLLRAKAVAKGEAKACHPEYRVVTNPVELDEYFHEIALAEECCAFDIETTSRGGEAIRCIGFSASPGEAVVVNFEDLNPKALDLLAVIRKHMTAGAIGWIGQNAYNFDIPMIKKLWGFEVVNFVMDTMVAHHCLYPEFPHDLATIASFYTTIPYWKDTSEENLHKYNAYDACATFTAAKAMWKELWERGWEDLYRTYYQELLTPLSKMTMRGMRIDQEYQQKLKEELKGEAKELQKALDEIYGEHTNTVALERRLRRFSLLADAGRKTVKLPNKKTGKFTRKRVSSQVTAIAKEIKKKGSLNVRSTKDLAHFLYNVLKLPKKTKQGKVTTDVTALNQLFIKTHHPFLKTMITLRTTRNMLSRWGNIKTDEHGLIGTTYSFADTGRLRSGKFEAK
jgi:DNA polymerase